MSTIPLISIKCGRILKERKCYLVLRKNALSSLDLFFSDGKDELNKLQCENISAIDLKVEAKFGSIDELAGFLLIECSVLETNKNLERNSSSVNSLRGYLEESSLVQVKFHVDHTRAVRDMLQILRSQSTNLENTLGITQSKNAPRKVREGLPDWVIYIPHGVYSRRTRQFIDCVISLYFIFSFLWAIWQLHRHVDFVREFVKPLVEFVQYQYQLVDNIAHLLNTLFEKYTIQWLCVIKPLYTLTSSMTNPLLQTVATSYWVLWPIISPFIQVLKVIKKASSQICLVLCDNFIFSLITKYLQVVFQALLTTLSGLGQSNLDPLKAQFLLIRSIIMQSGKAVFFGVVHFVKRIYKFVWLRRSGKIQKNK